MRTLIGVVLLAIALAIAAPPDQTSGNHGNDVHTTQWGLALYDSRLPPEVVHNIPGLEWRVGGFTTDAVSLIPAAISDWNSALQTSPNSLNKYAFHYLSSYDYNSSSSLQIHAFSDPNDLIAYCGVTAPGCIRDDNDVGDPGTDFVTRPFHIYVDMDWGSLASAILRHELGHALFHNEHYNNPSGCSTNFGPTIMNALNCGGNITVQAHDESDFNAGYRPKDPPNLETMTTHSSSSVRHNWDASEAKRHNLSRYFTEWRNDTGGSFLGSRYDNATPELGSITSFVPFTLGSTARMCAHTRGVSNAGFTGGTENGPYGHYGCVTKWSGPQTSAGPFVATSHRAYGSVIKVTNYSGSSRDIRVLGPSLQDVGCSLQRVSNGGTYTCQAGVGFYQYPSLAVFVWNTSGTLVASGEIDFE